jgi:hypothetical protein
MIAGTFIDGLDYLVGLFYEVGPEGGPGLLAVPRTAVFAPETSHECEEGNETRAGGVSHGTIVSRTGHYTQPP